MEDRDLIQDNLSNSYWIGEVVDIDDPEREGRIRVRVFGKFDELDIDSIPWATPHNRITGGSESGSGFHSVPKLQSIVGVIFDNGNLHEPEWYMIQNISDELKNEISGSYENAHSLIYDTIIEGGLKIFFTEEKGLMFDYKSTKVNIKPDNSITIENPNGDLVELKNNGRCNVKVSQKVDIDCNEAYINAKSKAWIDSPQIDLGKNATESVIKGETFQALFNSHTHVGFLGITTSPPVVPLTGSELSKITKTQ